MLQKLYPSIQLQLALLAMKEAFATDNTMEKKTSEACDDLIKFNFNISYKGKTFSSKIGIPTGRSLSQQIADIPYTGYYLSKKSPAYHQ